MVVALRPTLRPDAIPPSTARWLGAFPNKTIFTMVETRAISPVAKDRRCVATGRPVAQDTPRFRGAIQSPVARS